MNYNEFKSNYKWMLKKYYAIENTFGYDLQIDCIIEHYEKSGNRWLLTDSKTEKADNEYYYNTVDAIPFFKNLGGSEKVDIKATKYGYIPYKITSISPCRTEKTIRTFVFN